MPLRAAHPTAAAPAPRRLRCQLVLHPAADLGTERGHELEQLRDVRARTAGSKRRRERVHLECGPVRHSPAVRQQAQGPASGTAFLFI
jgi:hypothetical protein